MFRISEMQPEKYPAFEGMKLQGKWNGWERPVFELEEAKKIAEAFGLKYCSASDTFSFEEESFKAIYHEGKKVYPIGTDMWCWTEVTIETLVKEFVEIHEESAVWLDGAKYEILRYYGNNVILVDDNGIDRKVTAHDFYTMVMMEEHNHA